MASPIARLPIWRKISRLLLPSTGILSRWATVRPKFSMPILTTGLALIEPLSFNVYGSMMLAGVDMHEPLGEAAAVLADMATQDWPRQPEAAPGVLHTVHDYDEQAQLIEVDLLPSWYIPFTRNVEATAEQRESFAAIWSNLLPLAAPTKPQWTIRDYHSPNLLWIPERVGLKRVGIIDSQDAVMGHPAYDWSRWRRMRVLISPWNWKTTSSRNILPCGSGRVVSMLMRFHDCLCRAGCATGHQNSWHFRASEQA